MKKIKQNRFWFGITTTLLTIMLSFTFLDCATSTGFAPLTLPTEPSFHRDAVLLVNTVEETHPIFIYRAGALLPSYYRERRSAFITETLQPMTKADFIMAIRRYVAALHDGHMGSWVPLDGLFLDIPFTVRDNRLFNASNVEVLRIGGAEVQNIFALVDRHFFAENEIRRNLNHTIFAGYEHILRLAGADISNDGEVTLSLNDGYSTARFTWYSPNVTRHPQVDFIIEYRMIGDVFLIDLRLFYFDEPYLTNAVNAIEEAVNNGMRYFIVDLRGNPGGNSTVGVRLLRAMGVSIPGTGVFRRISPLAIEQRPWEPSDVRQVEYAPDPTTSNPNNVFVSVLTDVLSTSGATMMATWVQDGRLGNVIGSPPGDAPSMFADMLLFSLPYSGIDLAISYSRFLRPDTNADQNVVLPDILVDSRYALDKALQFFREKRY